MARGNVSQTAYSGYYEGRTKPRKTKKYRFHSTEMIKLLRQAEEGDVFLWIHLMDFNHNAVYLQNHSYDGKDLVKNLRTRMDAALGCDSEKGGSIDDGNWPNRPKIRSQN